MAFDSASKVIVEGNALINIDVEFEQMSPMEFLHSGELDSQVAKQIDGSYIVNWGMERQFDRAGFSRMSHSSFDERDRNAVLFRKSWFNS